MKHLVFLYGEKETHPEARGDVWAAGELRYRGMDAAARFHVKGHMKVWGELHPKTDSQLAAMDKQEAPQYRRTSVILGDGRRAFAYEYREPDFNDLPLATATERGGGQSWRPSTARKLIKEGDVTPDEEKDMAADPQDTLPQDIKTK